MNTQMPATLYEALQHRTGAGLSFDTIQRPNPWRRFADSAWQAPATSFDFPGTCPYNRLRLLLDSRVVEVLKSSNRIVVTLASLKALFIKGLLKALPFSGNVGAEDPGIQ